MLLRELILMNISSNILKDIHQYCDFHYSPDQSWIEGNIDVVCGTSVIGNCQFSISIRIIEKGFLGDDNYPPFPDIINFVINNITITTLVGSSCQDLLITKELLNDRLRILKGTVLKL